jgi:catechol 1,2-dioxygenase
MINESDAALTADVYAVMARTRDQRLREIMLSLVKHLHGFVRETHLTEAEFREATMLLVDMGHQSTDRHNEVVLMAGSLGVSALVCLLNNGNNGTTETTQNLLGPFWRMHAPIVENGGSIVRGPTPGAAMLVTFRFIDQTGQPVPDAVVDIWHSSPAGFYENQDASQPKMNLRGQFTTDIDGKIWFRSIRPAGYPIPTTGVVGQLLAAQDRHPYRPAHVHALALKPGYKTLISQIYADDDARIHSDVQFGVTPALLGRFVKHDTANTEQPDLGTPWYALEHTLVMEPGEAVLPRPPIK